MKDLLKQADSLSTSDLDQLISELGKLRASKSPEVTSDIGYGKTVAPILDPKYWTQPDDLGTVLAVRHPGYGWLWFLFPHHERENLMRLWNGQGDNSSAPLPPSKLN